MPLTSCVASVAQEAEQGTLKPSVLQPCCVHKSMLSSQKGEGYR